MILEAFIAQVEAIAQASPVYRPGGDGSDGTCDCIGLVIGAIRRAGKTIVILDRRVLEIQNGGT